MISEWFAPMPGSDPVHGEAVQTAMEQLDPVMSIAVAAQRQMRAAMDYQLAFETLLADLSACFVNLTPAQVDMEIQQAQRCVCEYFQLDRSAIWQFLNLERGTIQLTHLHHQELNGSAHADQAVSTTPAGDSWRIPMPEAASGFVYMEGDKDFPWITRQFRNQQPVIISQLDDLPAEAARDKDFLRHYGTRSSVMIPLVEGGMVLGAMSFAMVGEDREWPEPVVNRLKVITRIFTHALARKRIEQTLRENEARLTLAADSANAGLWDLNMDSGDLWATSKTLELFGLVSDEKVTLDRLLSLIHPEDVERFHQTIRRSAQSGEPARTDFRILLPGGQVRWIASSGRAHARVAGEPVRVMGVALDITERKRMEEELQKRLNEITELKKQLEWENIYLKDEFRTLYEHCEIVGQSQVIQKVFQKIAQVAPTDSHVLITGETGTGKELVAQAIHAVSRRKDRILVKVNCATLPSSLIESELFGREKGAYTGALNRQVGRFELANKGTIFLDEIGELSVELQSKLLRVIQEGEFERLGDPKTVHVDVRVIAATNRDLVDAVRQGNFRKDLYYRLSVFPIEVPPLRMRADDIPLLVWAFIEHFGQRMGKSIKSVPQQTMEKLKSYAWPGNVRELRNTIEHAMILSQGERLEVQMPEDSGLSELPALTFKEAEQHLILDALQRAEGHIKGPYGAAALLGLKPSSLYAKMQKLGIQPRRARDARPS